MLSANGARQRMRPVDIDVGAGARHRKVKRVDRVGVDMDLHDPGRLAARERLAGRGPGCGVPPAEQDEQRRDDRGIASDVLA